MGLYINGVNHAVNQEGVPVENVGDTLKHFVYDPVSQKLVADRAIETTLNSLFLGEQHKMSSGAENIFFTNMSSDINFFPMWGGLKDQSLTANQGASGFIPPSGRVYTDMFSLSLGGSPNPTTAVGYSGPNYFAVNIAGLGITTVAAEQVDMDTRLEYRLSVNGRQVYKQVLSRTDVIYPSDQVEWFFDHPVEIHAGTTIFAEIIKVRESDDSNMGIFQVRQGDTADPSTGLLRYQAIVHNRLFEDKDLELISPYLKYQAMDFGVDTTGSSIFLRDLTLGSESSLAAHGINTIEAVANGANIKVKLKNGQKVLIESLPVSGASIDGTSVNSVLNQAVSELNDLFTNGLSFASQGNPVTGFALSGDDLTLTLQDSTSYTVDVTTLGVDENKFVQSAALSGTDLELTMNDATVITVDASSLAIDTDVTVSSGVVSGTDIVLTMSDSSTITIDASSLDTGSSTQVASGAVVGNNLVLTMSDSTTVTIDASNMVNGSNLPSSSANWYITYGADAGDLITTPTIVNSYKDKQPFYYGNTLEKGTEFTWTHNNNGTYILGIYSGAASTQSELNITYNSNWSTNFKFSRPEGTVKEASFGVDVASRYSSGYSITTNTVFALRYSHDNYLNLFDISNGGEVLIGRSNTALAGDSITISMGGENQPNATFPVITKRQEMWTIVHDFDNSENGIIDGIEDHTVIRSNLSIEPNQKIMLNLSMMGRSNYFGLNYQGASSGNNQAETQIDNIFMYGTGEQLLPTGTSEWTLNSSASNFESSSTGWRKGSGIPAGMLSVRYLSNNTVELWSEDEGELIMSCNETQDGNPISLYFGVRETTNFNTYIPTVSKQTIGQGTQPLITFAPNVADQSFDVTEADSLNAQIVSTDYIVNQWVETDAPSWVTLNQNTGVLTGTAPAYTGTAADTIVINCKAANAVGGTVNFQVTLNVQEITYTNTKSLKFADSVNSYLGGNAALVSSLERSSNGSGSSDAWTVAFWYKRTNVSQSGQTLFYFGNNDTVNNGFIELKQTVDGRIRLRYGSNVNHIQVQSVDGTLTTNVWTQIVVTYDGGTTGASQSDLSDYYSRFKIYSNGSLMSVTNSHNNYGYTGSIVGQNYRFGRLVSGNYPKDGLLNQLAIWGSDQSSNISTLYNSGATQDLSLLASPPAHYYEIESSTTLVSDLIGTAHLVGYNFASSDLVTDAP